MRIAVVVTGGFDRSGRERVIPSLLWLVARLSRRHAVTVYVLRHHADRRRYQLVGATVQDLGRPAGLARQYAALNQAMRADGPFDLVHGYWAHPAGLTAVLAARRRQLPSIVTCDSGEFIALDDIGYGLQRSWRGRTAVAVATRLASRVTVCSQYQAQLARRHGVQPTIVPLGIDRQALAHLPDRRPVGGRFRLLTVASLNPVKDHGTLLAAVRMLADRGAPVVLDIVGEDTLAGEVRRQSTALDLDNRVSFHGFVPTDRLADYYAAADLFVLPSRHEAAGVVLLEAAAAGVPVVGSRVGYIADWSPDLAVGVPPQDPASLAAAIADLIDQPERRATLASRARAWSEAHDADWTADRFDELYRELATTSQHNARPVRQSDSARSGSPGQPPSA
jgi:glycosyltransferase involved in cell wall biosynthesis